MTESDLVTNSLELDEDITGVLLNLEAIVFLTPGPTQNIRVTSTDRVFRRLSTTVSEGVWVIELARYVEEVGDVVINIQMPSLRYLELLGEGKIQTTGRFEGSRVRLVLDGSGVMQVGIDADELFVDHENTGMIKLSGSASRLDINLAGSGNIESFSLPASRSFVNVAASGSGTAEVQAKDSLRVDILGPGHVLYRGDPVISQRITGTGTISSAN